MIGDAFLAHITLVYKKRSVLWDMVVKNVKSRYIGSVLGVWWLFLSPLLMILAISFVFSHIFNVRVAYFPLFILSGILPWMFLAGSVSESFSSLVMHGDIIRQCNIPKVIIPLAIIGSNFINLIFSFLLIVPVFVFFKPGVLASLLYLPLISFFYICFVTGIALALAALYVFFRDIAHILNSILMVWFWVTPVFYSVEMIPQKLRIICYLNPLSFFMQSYRDVLYNGLLLKGQDITILFFVAFTMLFLGYGIFYRLEKFMVKRI